MRILCWRLCSRGVELTNNISSSINDLYNDLDPLYLNGTSFMFGVALNNDINNIEFDDSYLNIKLKFSKKLNDVNFIEIPLEKWTYSHFSQFNRTLLDNVAIQKYLCPKSLDFYLQGNYFSDSFGYISLINFSMVTKIKIIINLIRTLFHLCRVELGVFLLF